MHVIAATVNWFTDQNCTNRGVTATILYLHVSFFTMQSYKSYCSGLNFHLLHWLWNNHCGKFIEAFDWKFIHIVFSKNKYKVYSALNISHDMRKRQFYRRGQMD